ncbi:hypothetical protein ACHAXT_004496 [Thalassiosira profunda]
MQYITPRDDTSALSAPERSFLRAAARGTLSSNASLLRLDGRTPSEARPVRLSFARCHNRSECVVQFASGTRGAASVRAELTPPPNADRPNDGQVKFNVEVGPMGCMGYETVGPVSNYGAGEAVDGGQMGSGGGGDAPYVQRLKSNRILRILERTLLIGGAMDAEALCVQSGTWVWRLHVDVSLLDDGGNAIDASVLAAVAALRHYRLPEVDIGGGDDGDTAADNVAGYQETRIVHSDDREPTPLPLHHTPLTATFALFADESGTTTAVSALLDPFDREELACDGLLTWSYNKYGEMCCLDFPGGCELRPRQLMASAKLGKRRCVEICELLETALEEAEGKAQKERMERLKALGVDRPATITDDVEMVAEASSNAMDVEEDITDAAARKEEEEYRQRALDYSSGHFAATVKEDKEKKASQQGKNARGETSSLFHAILRSAQSTATPMDAAVAVSDGAAVGQRKESVVEIIAHERKPAEAPKEETVARPSERKLAAPAQQPSVALDSDEEEVVQLASEFSAVPRERDESANPTPQQEEMQTESAPETTSIGQPKEPTVEKKDPAKSKPKSKAVDEANDVTDLTQALKKKKKSKKSSKKK